MKMIRYLLYLSPILFFIIIATVRELDQGRLCSADNPVKLFFTPSVDAETVMTNARDLVKFLEEETGCSFEIRVPTSYIAVVEAFGTGKADIAIMNTFSYLLAHHRYGAQALLRTVRRNETTYKGQILARSDSGIASIADIQGRRMAFVDPSSTSGYILPKALLQTHGVRPGEEIFTMKHDNVVTMIYQGQVDAGATYYSPPDAATGEPQDARQRVKRQFPDVMKKIKIIAFTETIPNDPLVCSISLPEPIRRDVVRGFERFSVRPEGRQALSRLYGVTGFVPARDSDYDPLRRMLTMTNRSLDEILR